MSRSDQAIGRSEEMAYQRIRMASKASPWAQPSRRTTSVTPSLWARFLTFLERSIH